MLRILKNSIRVIKVQFVLYHFLRFSWGVFEFLCLNETKNAFHDFRSFNPPKLFLSSYIYSFFLRCTKRARLEGCFIFVPTKCYNTEATHQRGWMVRIVLFLYTIQPTWKRWLGNKRNFLSIFLLQICKIYILKFGKIGF